MALVGDLVPLHQRQVAIARLLGVALTANVLGASIAGVIGDLFGWRGVFAVLGLFSLAVAIAAFFAFRKVVTPAAGAVQPRHGDRELHAAYSPIRARRSASARCSWKRSSSRGCSLTWPCC